jgi:hypothetical protein
MAQKLVNPNGTKIPIEDGAVIEGADGRYKYFKNRNAPPERYTKLLISGATSRQRAFKGNSSVLLFFLLLDNMSERNIVYMPTPEAAAILGVSPAHISEQITRLVKAQILQRTGKRSVLMINPHIACKCNDEQLYELSYEYMLLEESVNRHKDAEE